MPWPVSSSRTVYDNPWIRVREDQVTRPDGAAGVYGVVSPHHPAVFVVAVTEQREVVMVEIGRHTTGRVLEIPGGSSDGQHPLIAAERELREETGLAAARWHELGVVQSLSGVAEAPGYVFLATDVRRSDDDDAFEEQREEGISAVRLVPWRDLMQLVRDGRVTDAETLAALMQASLHLGLIDERP